jgi:hypothetical protein
MALQDEIDKARAEIRSDSYGVSIGEWISLYEKNELDIHPEFQRFFRWSAKQKSRFIESNFPGHTNTPDLRCSTGGWGLGRGRRIAAPFYDLSVCRNPEG